MKDYPAKEKIQNVLSVATGALTGFAFLSFLTFFLLLALASTANRDTESAENSSLFAILAVLTTILSSLLAGYITAKISTRKTIIHLVLTGLVLVLIMAAISDFDWKTYSVSDWSGLLLTVPSTILGGIRVVIKESKSKI